MENIEYFNFTSEIDSREDLYGHSFSYSDKNKKAIIVLLHDFCSHSGAIKNLRNNLSKALPQVVVSSFDFFGHGKSGGDRLAPIDFESYLYDLKKFIEICRKKHELGSVTLVGVGLGASLALAYQITYDDKNILGINLINPLLKINFLSKPFSRLLSDDYGILSSLRIDHELEGKDFHQDNDLIRKFNGDPLSLKFVTRGYLKMLRVLAKFVRTRAYFIDCPVQISVSTDDDIFSYRMIDLFKKGLSSDQIEHHSYEGKHFFFLENEEKFVLDLKSWVAGLIEQESES